VGIIVYTNKSNSSSTNNPPSIQPYNSSIEIFQDTNYEKYIAGGPVITAFCGKNISIIIDNKDWLTETKKPIINIYNTQQGLDAMAKCVIAVDNLINAFTKCVARIPTPNYYQNRPFHIESAYINAAGLASHGTYGMACGPSFINDFYKSALDPIAYKNNLGEIWTNDNPNDLSIVIPHVLCYEICRNYIFPDEFTPVFDYCLLDSRDPNAKISPSNWGWVNQGFVNITGTLLVADMESNIGFNYGGHSMKWFFNYMENHLDQYILGGLSWDETFMHDRLLWAPDTSLDNVYSGIIIRLWRNYGRRDFLRRWFASIPLLIVHNKNSIIARENFFIAACMGAQQNLQSYFVMLRWPIRSEVYTKVNTLLSSNPIP